jgi:hypothetical protein
MASMMTYQFVKHRSPEIVMVDLAYLNNGFVINFARYLTENNLSEDEVQKMVTYYQSHLETLLQDVSKSGNYLLIQKQMVISENIPDLTKEIEKALFQTMTQKLKKGDSNEKTQ